MLSVITPSVDVIEAYMLSLSLPPNVSGSSIKFLSEPVRTNTIITRSTRRITFPTAIEAMIPFEPKYIPITSAVATGIKNLSAKFNAFTSLRSLMPCR